MKYVTFHWGILGGVQDVELHDSKEAAIRFYRNTYKSYFALSPKLPRKIQTPFQVGFPHRRYIVMTKRMFDKTYGKKE